MAKVKGGQDFFLGGVVWFCLVERALKCISCIDCIDT